MSDKKVAPKSKAAPEKSTAQTTEKAAAKPRKKYVSQFSFADPLQDKFVNCIMKNGKKTVAVKILKDTLEEMHRRGQDDPLKCFELALKNATPAMEVKAKRIGGAVYQIPMEVTEKRQQSLCIRWVLEGARKKKGQPMFKRLAAELLDASNETGFAYGRKEDVHRMAQANKAFAHLARY
ncbi:30S ribosomal protein S7 [bacterium]|nr:30S ribosomal protein S7 [bacterium]NCQ54848.1 30S ribosomal protein S7 [Candidatus Parcubacteria bacterium]NCS66892.1 30S ribosomal protein S7 [Candidatus Peregrinibacteria bacterium]NCS95838.1 30S ribosomal protein S7 [bacterium]